MDQAWDSFFKANIFKKVFENLKLPNAICHAKNFSKNKNILQ